MFGRILDKAGEGQDVNSLIFSWRRERAFRVGRMLTVIAFFLCLASMVLDLQLGDQLILWADLVFLAGCFLSLTLSRPESGKAPYFLWWPAYISFWLSSLPILFISGGLKSPYLGLFLTLYFLAALIIQTEIKPVYLAGFVLLNLTGWTVLDYFAILPEPEPLSSFFLVSSLAIVGVGIIACALIFFKAEKELAREIVQSYRDLQETKAQLGREVAANAAKRDFLANTSHELRTTLGAIIGFADLAAEQDTSSGKTKEYIDIIRRNAKHMARLIDDLLDISKIEAGKIEVELAPFCPRELFQDVIDLLSVTVRGKGIEIVYEESGPLPERLKSDPFRIKQIFTNLLNNAIKFTDHGKVQILVEFEQDKDSALSGKLRVNVIDTGRGLSLEEQSPLFKPYSQADASVARQYGGTGLGLHLARKLAALLGGELILLSSERGVGSVFSFVIPVFIHSRADEQLFSEAKDEASPRKLKRLDGLRVLAVDDSIDHQMLLQTYLMAAGAAVTCVQDGIEAINEALEHSYDIVIMDVQMPVVDGMSATRMLRQKGFDRPIIALTAKAMPGEGDRCRMAGYNAYISKPLDPKSLIQTVLEQVELSKSSRLSVAVPPRLDAQA